VRRKRQRRDGKQVKQSITPEDEKFDASLIGLSIDDAFDKIAANKLHSNLKRNKTTGVIEVYDGFRITMIMLDYLTVEANDKRIVVAVNRG
jgi:hypothetical protein